MTRSAAAIRTDLATSIGWLVFWLTPLVTLLVVLVCFAPAALPSWFFALLGLFAGSCIKLTDVIKYRLEYRETLANPPARDEAANT